MSPLLTIYTPTYRRPQLLARCQASVAAQTDQDIQHLIIRDEVGLGVGGMFAAMPSHMADVAGEWVYVLSDDDYLTDPQVVAEFRAFAEAHPAAEIIMCRQLIGGVRYPRTWMAPPELGAVSLSCWFVRRAVFARIPYGCRYEGDFDFIAAVWAAGLPIAWWDRVVCDAPHGWGRGEPE